MGKAHPNDRHYHGSTGQIKGCSGHYIRIARGKVQFVGHSYGEIMAELALYALQPGPLSNCAAFLLDWRVGMFPCVMSKGRGHGYCFRKWHKYDGWQDSLKLKPQARQSVFLTQKALFALKQSVPRGVIVDEGYVYLYPREGRGRFDVWCGRHDTLRLETAMSLRAFLQAYLLCRGLALDPQGQPIFVFRVVSKRSVRSAIVEGLYWIGTNPYRRRALIRRHTDGTWRLRWIGKCE